MSDDNPVKIDMSTYAEDQGQKQAPVSGVVGSGPLKIDMSTYQDHEEAPPVSMVGPNGEKASVKMDQVPDMRSKKYMVSPDHPGAIKFTSPEGDKLTYALPGEEQDFKKTGHTMIRPDGTFDLQNKPGEDPLDEAKRQQRVYKLLTPDENKSQLSFEATEGAKTGVKAAIATASAMPAAKVVSSVAGAAGASEAAELFASNPKLYTEYLAKLAAKQAAKHAPEIIKGAAKIGLGIQAAKYASLLGKIMEWW